MIEPTRQRPRHRDGLPRAARNCGGRLPRCRATAVLPPSRIWAKMRSNARFGVSSPHGRPAARADPRATSPPRWAIPGGQDLRGSSPALLSYSCFAAGRRDAKMRLGARFGVASPHGQPARPAPLRPVRGGPEARPRRPGHARARPWRALCAAGLCRHCAPRAAAAARLGAPGARRTRPRPETRRRARAKHPARRGAWARARAPAVHAHARRGAPREGRGRKESSPAAPRATQGQPRRHNPAAAAPRRGATARRARALCGAAARRRRRLAPPCT
jgi:hypothetical protein